MTSTLTAAVEDYLKAIFVLEERSGGAASTNALASRLEVSAPSVTGMVKKLARLELVVYDRYRGVRLTDAGRGAALEIVRHHRLLELFLVEEFGMPWDAVDAEADRLEHVLSEEVEQRIAARLGEPTRDPHGDPIPTRDGSLLDVTTVALRELAVGDSGTIARISDSSPGALRELARLGVGLHSPVELVRRLQGGRLRVRFGDSAATVSADVADAVRVEVAA
jgi:DtxR family transcriptional regulator, Mn-dependent transcriptional regulator